MDQSKAMFRDEATGGDFAHRQQEPRKSPEYQTDAEQNVVPPPYHAYPQNPQPQYGQPQYGQPQYGQPQYGQADQQHPVQVQPATYIYAAATPLANPPNDYLSYSIFVTICCCWLIGIFAIIRSSECRSAVQRGDVATAQVKSVEAKRMANIALGVGIALIAVIIIINVIRVVLAVNQY